MKYSTKTRIKAAALAALMLLTSVPVSALTSVRAQAAVNGDPELVFLGTSVSNVAEVITGQAIDIEETYYGGTYASEGIVIRIADGVLVDETNAAANGVTITMNEAKTSNNGVTRNYSIRFDTKFDPEAKTAANLTKGDPKLSRKKQFTIEGTYSKMFTETTANERTNKVGSTICKVKIGNDETETLPLAIMQRSVVRFRCTQSETESGGVPQFELEEATGYFAEFGKKYDNDGNESASGKIVAEVLATDPRTYDGNLNEGDTPDKVLGVTLSSKYVRNSIGFTLYPKSVYTHDDPNDTESPAGQKKQIPDNLIRGDDREGTGNGTVFEIVFEPPSSTNLFLTVMTPQAAMEEVEQQLVNTNTTGVGNQSYIRLADGEALGYIETDFDVRYMNTRYNSNFYVDWRWIPTGVMWNNEFKALDDYAEAYAKEEVRKEENAKNNTNLTAEQFETELEGSASLKSAVDAKKAAKKAEVEPLYKNLLKPPILNNSAGYSQWLSAGLPNSERERLEDDVQGYLVPTVYYAPNNNQKSITADVNLTGDSAKKDDGSINLDGLTTYEPSTYDEDTIKDLLAANPNYPVKQIIIKGTGVKPTVTVTSKTQGQDSGPVTQPNLAEELAAGSSSNPNSITMDAYQGGIPEYNQKSKGPFQETLTLGMGQKNGASPRADITITGDLDALTFQFDADDGKGTQIVPPGTASFSITNGRYEDGGPNVTEGHPWLEMTLQPYPNDVNERGTVFITITFYKKNANGQDEVNQNAVYYIRINPNDSTPGQDNRLYSILIRDQDNNLIGEEQGYVFDKDTHTYNVTIPFSANAIKLYPTQYDTDAVGYTRPIGLQMTDKDNNPIEILRLEDRYLYPLVGAAADPDAAAGGTAIGLADPPEEEEEEDEDEEEEGEDEDEEEEDPGDDDDTTAKYAPSIILDAEGNPKYAYRLYNAQWSFLIPFYEQKEKEADEDKNDMDSAGSRVGQSYTLTITPPTHDPRVDRWKPPYTLKVTRAAPSQVNTLDGIGIYLETAEVTAANNLIQNFNREKDEYEIWIPYSTQRLRIQTQLTDSLSDGPRFSIAELPKYTSLDKMTSSGAQEWLQGVKGKFNELSQVKRPSGSNWDGTMKLQFTVKSEEGKVKDSQWKNGDGEKTYTVIVHREDPGTDSNASSLTITDNNETVLEYTPEFRPDTTTYTLDIPYSVKQIKFNVGTNDPNVYKVEIWEGNLQLEKNKTTGKDEVKSVSKKTKDTDKMLAQYINGEEPQAGVSPLRLGVLSGSFDVDYILGEYARAYGGYHPFHIFVWAENENDAVDYLVRVRREEPSTDASMADLQLKNQSNEEIKTFVFNPDQYGTDGAYHITVPYSTKGVSFTPTTSHPYATVVIREELLGNTWKPFPLELASGATSRVYELKDKPGEEKRFRVEITAEDGETTRYYYIYISREAPSDDARLKSLVTQNTSDFKPIFISSKTEYTATVNEGAPGVILIPTANHPGATIRVDGVVVQSGSPTDLIELLEITQTVRIEVIAEDGVTRMVYRVTFTNPNLIEKTSNADLSRLTINYGLMTPNFQAAILNYEVTTKENAWSVDIIPKVADPLATMRVLNGTLELGDYNGNYAMAITDGQNDVSVEVTSPDGTVTKTYDVAIFRNDEEKLKNWTPLEAEDINFEQVSNPIIVKIEEYPRVGASVFNTLREEYPEYSIVFQGNDYSIRFDAKNLTRVIPQTEIYDFHMTLTSPDEDAIYDIIAERPANDDIINDVVMLYFDYHGSLPGPATFSLSLGRRYGNDLLYWHYYNQERDRIDYYGSLESNSQGNVAVSIDHFSTYVVSPEHRIAGSEDKDGVIDELGMVSNGEDLLGSGGKLNPNTGAVPGVAGEGRALPSFGQKPDLYTRKREDP